MENTDPTNKNAVHVQSRAVIIRDEHILLCQTTGLNKDFYFLPGGHIENGESAREALQRELHEEVGFTFEIKRFMGCFEYSFDPQKMQFAKCHTHDYSFIFEAECANLPSPDMLLNQLENHIKISWIALNQLATVDFRPHELTIIIPQWLSASMNNALQSVMVKKGVTHA